MKRIILAAIIVAAALLAGGIAYASIPDSNGTVNACYRTTTGELRVSDTSCLGDETTLVLNKLSHYIQVSSQETFTHGNSDQKQEYCGIAGEKVVGGGFEYVSGASPSNVQVISSFPASDSEWDVRIQVNGSTDLVGNVYIICANG